MSLQRENKLKKLLEQWPPGQVATSKWLKSLGISSQLTQRYLNSGWIEQVGWGAFKKPKDKIEWFGGLASMQNQLGIAIHSGGPTALSILGSAHYVRFKKEILFLFTRPVQNVPTWFLQYNWNKPIKHIHTSFLPEDIGLIEVEYGGVKLKVSSRERAILECLFLSPKLFDLVETYQILESLQTLRPDVMQKLLVNCNSVKVKRLFLYMAKKAKLPVMNHLLLNEINLGLGDRAIVGNGVYVPEFKISIPKLLEEYD
ncbi:MAG: type IV toxin-antitoxin system AbiEi family antitoxin [Saprospiraceae bacterium]|nr:type IV toxin-antitoxin system AbiEi family antitoxin [Saprospiraceae bacterium]